MAKKIIPLALILLGAAFILGALFSWFDNLTTTEPIGLGKWIFDILQFLVGAGAGIGGWLTLKKKIDNPDRKIEMKDQSKYFEKVENYYEASTSAPDNHDSIGFIPPTKTTTYVYRGKIEEEVRTFLQTGGTGAIVGLHAPGGLGKTELAKQTVQALSKEYEILWIDVGEKKPLQIIGDILTKCGLQTQPSDTYEKLLNELQHVYQTHRFLIVLDDVRHATLDNLHDILPPKPCAALVTSRIQQIGGVKTFALNNMNWNQSKQLFEAILGEEVVAAEIETLKKLANRCKYNPLAMEIAARRIRQFEGIKKPVARYFELAQARFSELKMEGDSRWDMEHIFDISYEDLSADDRKKLQFLAAFHPTGFSIEAISRLWQVKTHDVHQILSRFIILSLVKNVPFDDKNIERYRLHDLLDEYAFGKLKASGDEDVAKLALAQWLVELFETNNIPDIENMPFVLSEKDNLLHTCEWARGEKNPEVLALLITKPRNWFYNIFREAWVYWFAWLEACLQLGISDANLEANVLQAIGDVQQSRDERDAALDSYNEALKLFQAVGARLGEANVLSALCRLSLNSGSRKTIR